MLPLSPKMATWSASMNATYFFIDGSALSAQIRQLRRARPIFQNRKLCPKRFIQYLMESLKELHEGSYKRFTFYFPSGDETNVETHLEMPDLKNPGEVRDIHFKYCGHKLKKSAEFEKFVEDSVPTKFHDRFAKSEKGIDIEICCDALRLASTAQIERAFLLTNDSDFIPFCRTIKEFGANISLLYLSDVTPPNGDLLREVDTYDVVPLGALQQMFLPIPDAATLTAETVAEAAEERREAVEEMLSEKPEAQPSDLASIDDAQEETPTE